MRTKRLFQAIVASVIGLASASSTVAETPAQTNEASPLDAVRRLTFKPNDDDLYIRLGGRNAVTTIEDATAVEQLLGKNQSRQLFEQIDFAKQNIVVVSWTTSGPPEGALQHEFKGEGLNRRLVFYVQGPVNSQIRGQRARIAVDFFAVQKGVAIAFDATERF